MACECSRWPLSRYAASQQWPTQGTGWRQGSQPRSVASMRFVAAVSACSSLACMPACGPFHATSPAHRASTASSPASPTLPSTARRTPTCGKGADRRSKSAPTSKPSRPTRAPIRTYSSTGGAELVPEIAARVRPAVTVGAWIDKDDRPQRARNARGDRPRQEASQRRQRRGRQRDDLSRREDHRRADRARSSASSARASVPVTTGEIWNAWIEHPELASAVDFIAAHILPYWEGISETAAVDQAIRVYDKLRAGLSRQAHRDRRVRLAERRL